MAQRGHLRIARKAPGADRRSNQVNRPFQPGHDSLEDDAIELAQYEPLGAPGRPGNRTDHFGSKSVLANYFKGTGTGLEDQALRCQWTTRTGDA